jgi:hypothetical protein
MPTITPPWQAARSAIARSTNVGVFTAIWTSVISNRNRPDHDRRRGPSPEV